MPNFKKKFIIYTDASDQEIGGVLIQEFDGVEHSITWILRTLLDRKKNYTTPEKELLSVVWVIRKFKIYLQPEFIIRTDHKVI